MTMLTLFRPLAVAALVVAAVPAMPRLAIAQGPVAMAFAGAVSREREGVTETIFAPEGLVCRFAFVLEAGRPSVGNDAS